MAAGGSVRLVRLVLLLGMVSSLLSLGGTGAAPPARAARSAIHAAAQPLDTTPGPNAVTVAGDFQHLISGCSGDWQADCAATHMTKGAQDGVWRLTVTLSAGSYNYKAVIDDDWSVGSYGLHAASGGANISLALATQQDVTFYYDPATHWITDNVSSLIVTAAGNFQNEIGCPGDWQPNCLRSWMEDINGTGAYTYNLPAGLAQTDGDTPANQFQFKAALNESWDVSYGDGGGSGNITFTQSGPNQRAQLTFTAATHIPTDTIITTSSSHDNNVEYDGLAHDTRNNLYRVPFGTVNPGQPITLRLRTFHNDVTGVTLHICEQPDGQSSCPSVEQDAMSLAAANVTCNDAALSAAGHTCDYYQYTYTPAQLGVVFYYFIVRDGTATAFYHATDFQQDGLGVATPTEDDTNTFRIHVVEPAAQFPVIPWMQNGVMYQIFPDRFYNGAPTNDPQTTDPRYDYPAPPNATARQQAAAAAAQIQNRAWNQSPEGACRSYVNPTTPCTEQPGGRDYFGGDLAGIDQKLPYLKSLGVTILYLNPIFASASNHGYDTRDYFTINPYFGSLADFEQLVTDAGNDGMKIILDGVFNHASSDSPFFDRYGHYGGAGGQGACLNAKSPFRSWFVFTAGPGPCVDGNGTAGAANYQGWAGFDSLPVLVKRDPTNQSRPFAPVANYFYAGTKNVVGYWLQQGAAGWRFDVMTDPSFPAAYWQGVRTTAKAANANTPLIAEGWHWYDNLPLTNGDQADTAMGYRFREAILGLLGASSVNDDKGFPHEDDTNLPPSVFMDRIMSMREDYADATWYTFMNLLDSHDTARILWLLTPGHYNQQDREQNQGNVSTGLAREHLAAVAQMTLPGTPDIYYGDEVSLSGADDPDTRRPFPWILNADGSYAPVAQGDPYFGAGGGPSGDTTGGTASGNAAGIAEGHATFDLYQKLIALRKANPELSQGALTFLLSDDTNKATAYGMRLGNQLAITVLNLHPSKAQPVTVPTAGYLPDGVTLTDALGSAGAVTTTGGRFTVTLASDGAAVYVLNSGQNISGPAAPTNLTAMAGHSGAALDVALSWQTVSGAASYNVYRGPVQGGGYALIGNTANTTYTDTQVNGGTIYYYVVRAVDGQGNEGAASSEASATPALPIGYAVLQYPTTINQQIMASYTTVYGRVYVQGITDSGGDPGAITAQVGFGPDTQNLTADQAAAWTTWKPMTFNAGCSGCGNNFEYMGQIRAPAIGAYDYLVRFSDDGGQTWSYGDVDGYVPGGSSGTDHPGVMTINPSGDKTAPSAPTLSVADFSPASISLSWTTSSDTNDAVAEYHVFRGTSPGGEGGTPLATVQAPATTYTDNTVQTGTTYYYTVVAYDTSLNASNPSNEVAQTAQAKVVAVTFKVAVPAFTPPGDTVYISGNSGITPDPLCNYCGGNTATAMSETAPGSNIWTITLNIPDGTNIQYKYTRGAYNSVEQWGSITGLTNRVATVHANSASDLTETIDDTSVTTTDDNHHAVANWRDPLVTAATPTDGSATVAENATVRATFNEGVQPAGGGADFSGALTLTSGGTGVVGSVAYDASTHTLAFTPSAPLAPGPYTGTVNNLWPASDNAPMLHPYTFSFTVVPGPATSLALSGYPGTTDAGVSHSLTVTAKDANGYTASGYTGTVRFSSSDAHAVLPSPYTFIGDDQGAHTFTDVALETAGNQTISAADTATPAIAGQIGVRVYACGVTAAIDGPAGAQFSLGDNAGSKTMLSFQSGNTSLVVRGSDLALPICAEVGTATPSVIITGTVDSGSGLVQPGDQVTVTVGVALVNGSPTPYTHIVVTRRGNVVFSSTQGPTPAPRRTSQVTITTGPHS